MYFSFSVIFSFLAIFQVLQCAFLIFHIFSVILSFFKSSSGCFSFSTIFRFLAIFHVLQWTFLNIPPFSVLLAIFHVLKCVFLIIRDFQFSRHIPGPTVDISKFSNVFSFPHHISRPKVCIYDFPWFQFSRHIPGASLCISHFSRLSVISSFFNSSSGSFSFSMIFSFLPYSTSYSGHF